MTSSRRIFLKENTWSIHEKVESILDLNFIFRSHELYFIYLVSHVKIFRFHLNNVLVAPEMPSFLAEGLKRRLDAIESDLLILQHFGQMNLKNENEMTLFEFSEQTLGHPSDNKNLALRYSQEVRSVPFLLGFSYVIEGSAFGATLIKKWALENGQTEDSTHFFSINMSTAREHWTNFLEFLERSTEVETDSLLKGATAAFTMFDTYFTTIQNSDLYQNEIAFSKKSAR